MPISTLALDIRANHLYRQSIYFAKRFVSDMRAQGFGLIGEQGALLVTGPYPHLESDTTSRPLGAIGRHRGQEQTEEWADFLITGLFLRNRPLTFEYADPN